MRRFTQSIRQSIASENWFSALFLALAMPDVCAALEYPNETKYGKRYKKWFNKYLKRKYNSANQFEQMSEWFPTLIATMSQGEIQEYKSRQVDAKLSFSAEECWLLRCACMHSGSSTPTGGKKIHFTPPIKGSAFSSLNLFHGRFQIQIDIFCEDVCAAVERWQADVANMSCVQMEMTKLIEMYELSGLFRQS